MEWLKISTSTELLRVATHEIVYVLADGNYSDLVLSNGSVHKMTFQLHYFEDVFSNLVDNPFVRIGRSLIVNKRHIRLINLSERILRFGGDSVNTNIPSLKVGRAALKDLKEMLENE